MKVLVIFWLNSDNFETVIKRNPDKTMEEDLREYESEHDCFNPNTLIGVEIDIDN